MASFKIIGILIILGSLAAACLSQVLQRGAHESQGGAHESQGGAHVSQAGAHESQGRVHDSQGVHELQRSAHESPGVLHVSQAEPESQGRIRRQTPQALVDWVTCDFAAPTKISCHDCNTRVVCKPIGGILKPCSPQKPFCSNGVCSAVPSGECA